MRKKADDKRKRFIMVGFTVIFLVSSIAGVVLYQSNQDSDEVTVYNRKYRIMNDYYVTRIGGKDVIFYSLPTQVESIDASGVPIIRDAQALYLTFDPADEDLAFVEYVRYELQQELQAMGKYVLPGITTNSSIYRLAKITCLNSTPLTPVVVIQKGEDSRIYNEDSCVFIESSGFGFRKVLDRLRYSLYGVI